VGQKIVNNKISKNNNLKDIERESNRKEAELYRLNPGLKNLSKQNSIGYIVYIPTSKWSKPKYSGSGKSSVKRSSGGKSTGTVCKDSNGKIVACKKCVPPPWMKFAINEIGVQRNKNQGKSGSNPKILEYHATTSLKKDTKREPRESQSWCGSYVNFVMEKANYETVSKSYWALNWRNFGKKITKPIYGAIGVKKRIVAGRVKGHVSFFIGQSKDGKYYYMLGGNQTGASKVIVKRYTKKEWDQGFYVPINYDVTYCKTPIYNGSAAKGKDKD